VTDGQTDGYSATAYTEIMHLIVRVKINKLQRALTVKIPSKGEI